MKLIVVVAAFAAVSTLGSNALAAGPPLSGSYIVDMITVCQPGLQVRFGGGLVGQVVPTNTGTVTAAVLTMTFKPATSNVTITGVNVGSSLLKVFENSQFNGANPSSAPLSASWTYSNTATSLTMNGRTFSAVYGALSAGIVQSAVLAGVTGDNNNCVASLRLSR
jgi:hypothetical protein